LRMSAGLATADTRRPYIIENIDFDGNRDGTTGTTTKAMVRINRACSIVRNCRFHHAYYRGLETHCMEHALYDCNFEFNGYDGVYLTCDRYLYVANCTAMGNGNDGFSIASDVANQIGHITLVGCQSLWNIGYGMYLSSVTGAQVLGFTSVGNQGEHFYALNTTDCQIVGFQAFGGFSTGVIGFLPGAGCARNTFIACKTDSIREDTGPAQDDADFILGDGAGGAGAYDLTGGDAVFDESDELVTANWSDNLQHPDRGGGIIFGYNYANREARRVNYTIVDAGSVVAGNLKITGETVNKENADSGGALAPLTTETIAFDASASKTGASDKMWVYISKVEISDLANNGAGDTISVGIQADKIRYAVRDHGSDGENVFVGCTFNDSQLTASKFHDTTLVRNCKGSDAFLGAGEVRTIVQVMDHADITDGLGAAGTYDFSDSIPAECEVLAVLADITEAFKDTVGNNTSVAIMLGDGTDHDRWFNAASTGTDIWNSTTDIRYESSEFQGTICTSAAKTPKVTFTTDSDMTDLISGAGAQGAMKVYITFRSLTQPD